MNTNRLDYSAQRKRYDNIDGTGEIYMGMMLLSFALIGYAQNILPPRSFWMRGGSLLLMYGILLPGLGVGWLMVKAIKKHVTFPRTGYVACRPAAKDLLLSPQGKSWRKSMALVFAGSAALGAFLAVIHVKNNHIATHLGLMVWMLIFPAGYAFWIYKMGGGFWWKWVLGALLVAGLIALAMQDSNPLGWHVTLLNAAIWIASGLGTLLVYVRRHQVPPPEDSAL
jgi:hypothetical protein